MILLDACEALKINCANIQHAAKVQLVPRPMYTTPEQSKIKSKVQGYLPGAFHEIVRLRRFLLRPVTALSLGSTVVQANLSLSIDADVGLPD